MNAVFTMPCARSFKNGGNRFARHPLKKRKKSVTQRREQDTP